MRAPAWTARIKGQLARSDAVAGQEFAP